VLRILDVWRDRNIYSSGQLKELRSQITSKEDGEDYAGADDTLSSPAIDAHSPASPSEGGTPTKKEKENNNAEVVEEASTSTSPPEGKKAKLDSKAFFRVSTELVKRLKKLEEPASADAKVRQLIASYPAQIANPALLTEVKSSEQAQELMSKITEVSPIVTAYCQRLKAEVEDRQAVQQLIGEYLESLNDVSEKNKALIESVKRRISRMEREKGEVS